MNSEGRIRNDLRFYSSQLSDSIDGSKVHILSVLFLEGEAYSMWLQEPGKGEQYSPSPIFLKPKIVSFTTLSGPKYSDP